MKNINHILKVVSASLFAGSIIFAIGTVGAIDVGAITFEQVAISLAIELVVMLGSYAMLLYLDFRG